MKERRGWNTVRAALVGLTLAALAAVLLLVRNQGAAQGAPDPPPEAVTPAIDGAGGAFPIEGAALSTERRWVVFDVAEGADGDEPPPGLGHAARLLNVYAAHGVAPARVRLTLVVHGEATAAVLDDGAHRRRAGGANPHDGLVRRLEANGVRVQVCGQALRHRGFSTDGVLDEVDVVASAMTALIDEQRAGAALLTY
ncbi:MAG TPA: DsrE family protein [Sandaracinaceae bacterium LLY-WYZ-13_1]|nr:DsrE family protein [Sandaracinaceae bacterium LLY-WYZ-13_1]